MKVCKLNNETPVFSSLPKCWQLTLCSAREESGGILSGQTDQLNRKGFLGKGQLWFMSHCSKAYSWDLRPLLLEPPVSLGCWTLSWSR